MRTSVLSKDVTRKTITLPYVHMVMVVLTQNLLARVYTPTQAENVERNGHIRKAVTKHKDACVGNVENQTTMPRCVELWSS